MHPLHLCGSSGSRQIVAVFLIIILNNVCVASADCGFPSIPSGLQFTAHMSKSYSEGTVLAANCTGSLRDVSYRLLCEDGEWRTESQPPGILLQSCLTSGLRAVAINKFHVVTTNGSAFTKVPVIYDEQSVCYTSARVTDDQHWIVQLKQTIDPCFLVMRLRLESPVVTDQLPDPELISNQSVNCSFIHYSDIRDNDVSALFACDYRSTRLLMQHNRTLNSLTIDSMDQFSIKFPKQSLNLSAVSFCGIETQDCRRFDCGHGYPLPLHSSATRTPISILTTGRSQANFEPEESSLLLIGSTATLTLPVPVQETTVKVVYTCEPGHHLVSDVWYSAFGGMVCDPHGSWVSSPPVCVSDDEVTSVVPVFISLPYTENYRCIVCPYFTCLLISFVVLLIFAILTAIFNYYFMRRREEMVFIRGRESLLWVRKDLAASGRASCFESNNNSLHQSLRRKESGRSGRPALEQTYSYIDMQPNLFDTTGVLTDFNATTYFYLNRYEAVSAENVSPAKETPASITIESLSSRDSGSLSQQSHNS